MRIFDLACMPLAVTLPLRRRALHAVASGALLVTYSAIRFRQQTLVEDCRASVLDIAHFSTGRKVGREN